MRVQRSRPARNTLRPARAAQRMAPAERRQFSAVYQAHGGRPGCAPQPRYQRREVMRYVLLWLLGIPIPILILLAVFKVI